jgi:hypothetical protein
VVPISASKIIAKAIVSQTYVYDEWYDDKNVHLLSSEGLLAALARRAR